MPHKKRKSGDDFLLEESRSKDRKKRWSLTFKETSVVDSPPKNSFEIEDFRKEEVKVRKKKGKHSRKNGENSRSLSPTSRTPPPLPTQHQLSRAEQNSMERRNTIFQDFESDVTITDPTEYRRYSPSFNSVENKYKKQKDIILDLTQQLKTEKNPQVHQMLLMKKEAAVEVLTYLASARLESMENQRQHFIQSWMHLESQGEVKTHCIIFLCPDVLVLEKKKDSGLTLVSSMIINDTTIIRANPDTAMFTIESPHLQETLTLFPGSKEIEDLWLRTLTTACRANVRVEDMKRCNSKQTKSVKVEQGQLLSTKYELMRKLYSDRIQVSGDDVLNIKGGTMADWCLWALVTIVDQSTSDIMLALFSHYPRYTTPKGLCKILEKFKSNSAYTVPCLNLPVLASVWLEFPSSTEDREAEMKGKDRLKELICNLQEGKASDSYIKHRRSSPLFTSTYPGHTPGGMAQQITHVSEGFLISLRLCEFLEKRWEKRETSPRLHAFIDWSNALSRWCSHAILSEMDFKERVNQFKFFIKVAQELHNLRNYQACSSILGGLTCTAVRRLKDIEDSLTHKQASILQKLGEIYSPLDNFGAFKRLPEEYPNIPLLGIHMKSLFYAEEFMPNYLDEARTVINIEKCMYITSILKKLYVYKRRTRVSLYPDIIRDEEVIVNLQLINPPDEDTLYEMSQKIRCMSSRNIEEELLKSQEQIAELQRQLVHKDLLREKLLQKLEAKDEDPSIVVIACRDLLVADMLS